MEQTSDIVYDGKMLHEISYPQRAKKYQEIELDGIKIDFFDQQTNTIHEIKRSNSMEEAHKLQLKYYMYRLRKSGISEVKGMLEYPMIRKKEKVELLDDDMHKLEEIETDIKAVIVREQCPDRISKSFCRKCSYFDFCWSTEPAD